MKRTLVIGFINIFLVSGLIQWNLYMYYKVKIFLSVEAANPQSFPVLTLRSITLPTHYLLIASQLKWSLFWELIFIAPDEVSCLCDLTSCHPSWDWSLITDKDLMSLPHLCDKYYVKQHIYLTYSLPPNSGDMCYDAYATNGGTDPRKVKWLNVTLLLHGNNSLMPLNSTNNLSLFFAFIHLTCNTYVVRKNIWNKISTLHKVLANTPTNYEGLVSDSNTPCLLCWDGSSGWGLMKGVMHWVKR